MTVNNDTNDDSATKHGDSHTRNTKRSASSVLLTVFSVLCFVFFVTAVHTLDVDTSS